MILIFQFAFNQETKEAVFSGNTDPVQALHILQDLVIADVIRRAKEVKDEGTIKADSPDNL